MGIVRNFMDIMGITPENELPSEKGGYIIIFSEVENLFIPEDKEGIETIYQIMIDLKIKSKRNISTPLGKIMIADGLKNFKIIYAGEDGGQLNILNLNNPFNTFLDLPDNLEDGDIKVFILDAYFELIAKRRIYGHFIYMVELQSPDILIEKNNTVKSSPDLDIPKPVKAEEKEGFDIRNYIIDEVSISHEYKKSEIIENQANEENKGATFNDESIADIDSEYL